jgi:Fe-S cluster assembly protein SufD
MAFLLNFNYQNNLNCDYRTYRSNNSGIFYKNLGKKVFRSYKQTKMNNHKINQDSIENKDWINSILNSETSKDSPFKEDLRKIGNNLLKITKLPSKKDESWRFTKLDKLFKMNFSANTSRMELEIPRQNLFENSFARCVFMNGNFVEELSYKNEKNDSFFLGKFSDLDYKKKKKIIEISGKGESGINGGFFSILNMAGLNEIAVLYVPENMEISGPIQIIFAQSNSEEICINQKLIILCEKNSKAEIFQQHLGSKDSKFFDNSATNILVEEKSKINYFLINQIPEKSSCFNSIHADLKKQSDFKIFSFSMGGFLSRVSLGIDLNGIESNCEVEGVSVVKNSQISDLHSRISHNYPSCKSSQLQKNLISGNGHAIFAGKIQVHNGASETESSQLCKSLILSPQSRVDSMPILEINNENVKCTHGSTVSDLDEDQLFYFRSRGIPEEKARYLLTLGFVNELSRKLPKKLMNYFSNSIKELI